MIGLYLLKPTGDWYIPEGYARPKTLRIHLLAI
jgi:hypothetical protein